MIQVFVYKFNIHDIVLKIFSLSLDLFMQISTDINVPGKHRYITL